MKHRSKQLLSILLSLVMVLGLLPGMSLTAYAATLACNPADGGTIEDQGDSIYASANPGYSFAYWEMKMGGSTYTKNDNPLSKSYLVYFDTVTACFVLPVSSVTLNPSAQQTITVGGSVAFTPPSSPATLRTRR